jgi:hypothetical protein
MIDYYVIRNHAIYALSQEEIKAGSIKPLWINITDPTMEEEQIMKDSFGINMSLNNTASLVALPSCYYQSDLSTVFRTNSYAHFCKFS